MRLFELLLVIIGVIGLFDIIFLRTRNRSVLYFYVGLSALLLILQLLLEKYRWQMVPVYILVLFIIFLSMRAALKPAAKQKKPRFVLKILFFILAFAYVFTMVLFPVMLPVFSIENPKPEFVIGSTARYIEDDTRKDEPFSDSNRELMIQIWYPAVKSGNMQHMSYYPYPGMSEAFAEVAGYPDYFFTNINLVKTNSYMDADISKNQDKYPVLVFSHGYQSNRFDCTSEVEEMVRNGYIVVGIDHTHYSSSTVFPDGHITKVDVKNMDNNLDLADKAADIWIQDAETVIDRLDLINSDDPILAGRLDLEKLGYFGHSLGGATALRTLIKDERVKAAINMDGYIPGYAGETANKPYMIMMHDPAMDKFTPGSASENAINVYNDSIDSYYANSKNMAYILQIKKTVHLSFTDTSILTRVFNLKLTPPKRCFSIINDYTASFFDKYLKNSDDGLLDGTGLKYPEVVFKSNGFKG